MTRKISTIHEVARRCGVSVSTVSRVFNGYDDISEATRLRVLETARELDYAPSAAARTLVKQRSQLIGVVLNTGEEQPDIRHPFFQEVLVGLKHAIGVAGYDLLLFATEQPHAYTRRARHHRVDGVVLMGVDRADPELRKLLDDAIPTIAVDLDVEGSRASYITSDNVGGARLAVRHLHELGHERIATIAGLLGTKPGADRLAGYRAELKALGLRGRAEYEREGDFNMESGAAAMRRLLRLRRPPTAVFAASDLMAVGAIRAAREADLRVPEDLSVVGFDDIQIASLVSPALTTIRQDKLGLGTATGRGLLDLIEGEGAKPPVLTLPVELVVRESTVAP
ncbi:MAG TPA: LacI family DNA-binding transcriptional regulator [Gaiellaceae bacterium]|jgi:LacI family transcriptional regulator